MLQQTLYHEAKSKWSYIYDKEKLHIRLRVGKEEVENIQIVAYEPYNWSPKKENPSVWVFNTEDFKYFDMKKEHTDDHFDYWFGEISGFSTLRIRYGFLLEGKEENYFFGSQGVCTRKEYESFEYTGTGETFAKFYSFPYLNYEDEYRAPSWVKNTIWYQIYPARFYREENAKPLENLLKWNETTEVTTNMNFGGTLKGIIKKLDYIAALGSNGIYFTPMFKAYSDHKYDTTDYFQIDERLGSNQDFKEMVKEAHKRGIKVVLDGVFNHCGWDHPYWQDVLKKGKESKYYDCFMIEKDPVVNFPLTKEGRPSIGSYEEMTSLHYRTFAFNAEMPKWNTGNQIAREYLLNVGKYWVKEYDIDGWRLDVSNEVSHDFWKEYRKEIQKIKSEVYLVGENWDHSYPWVLGDQFDAVMNYEITYKLWSFLGTDKFTMQTRNAEEFVQSINAFMAYYPKNILPNMFNIVDSHDTARVMDVVGYDEKKAKILYAIQMFLPGGPSIYYGSEIGMTGDTPDNNRKCMVWEPSPKEHNLYKFLQEIIHLRKKHPALSSIHMEWEQVSKKTNSFILKKTEGKDKVSLLVNNHKKKVEFSHPYNRGEKVTVEPYDVQYMISS